MKGRFVFSSLDQEAFCYWPKYIPGDNIISHFTEKGIGESDALQGMLDQIPCCCNEGAR